MRCGHIFCNHFQGKRYEPVQRSRINNSCSVSLPSGLTREQELTYAAFTLQQQTENTKYIHFPIFASHLRTDWKNPRDKIRLNALCEAAYASKEPTENPPPHPPHSETRPNAFREAARQPWKRGTPPPVVKQSRRMQPRFHLQQESNSHVAIAKRAIARLNDYDKTMKPAIDAVNLAKEGRDANPGAAAIEKDLSHAEERRAVAVSRDPRLARGRA